MCFGCEIEKLTRIHFSIIIPQSQIIRMAYSWDNRVKFVVRFMYDIDNNGFLDKNDFECLAVRNSERPETPKTKYGQV